LGVTGFNAGVAAKVILGAVGQWRKIIAGTGFSGVTTWGWPEVGVLGLAGSNWGGGVLGVAGLNPGVATGVVQVAVGQWGKVVDWGVFDNHRRIWCRLPL
jgi:hypothetical protein